MRLRDLQEKQALGGLAQVLSSYNHYQQEIEGLGQEMQQESDKYILQCQKESIDQYSGKKVEEAIMWEHYVRRLHAQIDQYEKSKEQLRPELEKEQTKVRDARCKRRVLELLKDKEKKEYDRKFLKQERKALAEANQRAKQGLYPPSSFSPQGLLLPDL